MTQRILILLGHSDRAGGPLREALAQRCAQGEASAGHEPRTADVATLGFPLRRSRRGWQRGALPTGLVEARQAIGWATHRVRFLPLWRGDMPALAWRWYFRARRVKALERNIRGFCGIAPIGKTRVGLVDGLDQAGRRARFAKLHAPGVKAA